jgi:hypothetical protein
MKPDLYTKTILTVIALMLTVIACKTVLSPETTVSAQGPFVGLQYVGHGDFFDARTGEAFWYDDGSGRLIRRSKLTKLGEPMTVEWMKER